MWCLETVIRFNRYGGGEVTPPPTMGCFLAHSAAFIGFLIYFFFCVIVIQKLKIAFFWIKNYVSSSRFFTPLCVSTHGGARWRPLPRGVFLTHSMGYIALLICLCCAVVAQNQNCLFFGRKIMCHHHDFFTSWLESKFSGFIRCFSSF